jgi:hypothetical protein
MPKEKGWVRLWQELKDRKRLGLLHGHWAEKLWTRFMQKDSKEQSHSNRRVRKAQQIVNSTRCFDACT